LIFERELKQKARGWSRCSKYDSSPTKSVAAYMPLAGANWSLTAGRMVAQNIVKLES